MRESVHLPAVAGIFYPSDGTQLARSVDACLASFDNPPAHQAPMALVVPHAGYVYSGMTAGRAYSELKAWRDRIKSVVILGPSHRVSFRGVAAVTSQKFRTPLGDVPIDTASRDQLVATGSVQLFDTAHAQEHSVEVQIPFLQRVLGSFKVLPLVVGDASPEAVASIIDKLGADPGRLWVFSTDLSHFHDYDTACQNDAQTSASILNLNANLTPQQACGCRPLNGLLTYAKRKGLSFTEVARCNSGDTAGSKDRVVGYAAYTVRPGPRNHDNLSNDDREQLMAIARTSVNDGLANGNPTQINYLVSKALSKRACSFVTLHLNGKLRGCIGALTPSKSLAQDVADHAFAAAFRDPRFPPVTAAEKDRLEYHIAVIGESQPLMFKDEPDLLSKLRPGVDGLTIQLGAQRATFLPAVWETLTTPEAFLSALKTKAGMPQDARSYEASVYQTESWP